MKSLHPIRCGFVSAMAAAALIGSPVAVAAEPKAGAGEAKIVPLLSKDMANMPGKEGLMLTVEYPPGASTAEHRHNAHVFVYVLEGSVEMGVTGGKPVTLGPGQTFYEGPDDVHLVSRNASKTKRAKFVVFLVKDKGAAPVLPPR